MKNFFKKIGCLGQSAAIALLVIAFGFSGHAFASVLNVPEGGTGWNTFNGIIQGNGTAPFSTVTIGSGLTYTGGTLTAKQLNGQTSGNITNPAGTGTFETFLGLLAGSNTTQTTMIGAVAGNGATNADHATFVGFGTGQNAVNATGSTFIGGGAGNDAAAAANSIFIGLQPGNLATNAHDSIFIGSSTGAAALNAAHSIFIGQSSGNGDAVNNTVSGHSILIGDNTHTGGFKNSIAIGNAITNTATNQIAWSSDYTTMFLPLNGASAGDVLTNDGSGNATWQPSGGSGGTVSVIAPITGDGSSGNPLAIVGTPTQIPYYDGTSGALTHDSEFTRDTTNNFETKINVTDGTDTTKYDQQPTFATLRVSDGLTYDTGLSIGTQSQGSALTYNDMTGSSNLSYVGAQPNAALVQYVDGLTGFISGIEADNHNLIIKNSDGISAAQWTWPQTFPTGGSNYVLTDVAGNGTLSWVDSSTLPAQGLIGQTSGIISNPTPISGSETFLGQGAGGTGASTSATTFVGLNAGDSATAADNGTFIGTGAGAGATSANDSFFGGINAGSGATGAGFSVFIGDSAGFNDTVNNTAMNGGTSILIGKNTSTGGFSNSIALGNNATNTATNQFLIGSASIGGAAAINTITAPAYLNTRDDTGAFTPDNFTYFDPSGNLSVAPLSAIPIPAPALTATQIAFGDGSNLITSSPSFTWNGFSLMLEDNTSNHNLFIGGPTTPSGNGTTTGVNNLGVGQNSLLGITNGAANTAFGFSALTSVDAGSFNTAIGRNTLGLTTSGSANVALGENAGATNVLGSNNTFLGYQSDVSADGWTNSIALGFQSIITASNQLMVNPSVTEVQIGGSTAQLQLTGASGTFKLGNPTGIHLQGSDFTNIAAVIDGGNYGAFWDFTNHIYTFGDRGSSVNGTQLVVDDGNTAIFGNGTYNAVPDSALLTLRFGAGIAVLGDLSDAKNGTVLGVWDGLSRVISNGTYDAVQGSRFLQLDYNAGTMAIGDLDSSQNGNIFKIDDANSLTTIASNGNTQLTLDGANRIYKFGEDFFGSGAEVLIDGNSGIAQLGDAQGLVNGTKVSVDDPHQNILLNGSQTVKVRVVAADTNDSIVPGDYQIDLNPATISVTEDLPATPTQGDVYIIKDKQASITNTVIVNGNGNTIDGSTTQIMGSATQQASETYTFNGTEWDIN